MDGENSKQLEVHPIKDALKAWQTDDQSCPICERLEERLMPANREDSYYSERTLGTYEAVLAQGCIFCHPIFSTKLEAPPSIERIELSDTIILITQLLDFSEGEIVVQFRVGKKVKMLFHLARSTTYEKKNECTYAKGLKLNQDWINMDWLRGCIRNCFDKHSLACGTRLTQTLRRLRPMWLIDVRHMCVTIAADAARYFALSYVWGQTETLNLLSTNIDSLQRKNSLISSEYKDALADTVKDTIQLVRLLGGEYLWTDTLCIVQDDEVAASQQINSMASIYANADVTIVAMGGEHAGHGLPGIQTVSRPRQGEQRVHYIAGKMEVVELQPTMIKSHKWGMRGWTFQEDIFSARKIIFTDRIVAWECGYHWKEDEVSESRERLRVGDVTYCAWPKMGEYTPLVQIYNNRLLTYPEDTLRAFAGITTALSYSFEGGFISGLPEICFDAALLWEIRAGKRRKAADPSKNHLLPSWSWAGWQGAGYYYSCLPTYEIPKALVVLLFNARPKYSLIPRVRWYSSESPTSQKRLLKSNVLTDDYKQSSLDPTKPLPAGWSRCISKCIYSSDVTDLGNFQEHQDHSDVETYYTHISDSATNFWHPVPIREQEKPVSLRNLEPFIHCHTQRAYLNYFLKESSSYSTLRAGSKQWAGKLDIYRSCENRALEKENDCVVCELILISEGNVPNSVPEGSWPDYNLHEWDDPERPKDGPSYEWLNVLAVEWSDGIAYRKGLGRVVKRVWETLELEEIDVTLN